MKKIYFLICLLIGIGSVNAATITNSKYENGQITLSGTGTKQVQIVLFDKDNQPVYMATSDASSGKFSFTLPKIASLADGEYIVKAADYDGKNVASETVTVKDNVVVKITSNPNTNDNIMLFVFMGVLSLTVIIGMMTVIYIKKKNLKRN